MGVTTDENQACWNQAAVHPDWTPPTMGVTTDENQAYWNQAAVHSSQVVRRRPLVHFQVDEKVYLS